MTNVWGRRGISTLLLMQYLLIVVGHGAEGHSLGFSFKTRQVFSLSVSHSAHAKSARRVLFRIFITLPGFSARPPGSRKVKIKPYILHPLCRNRSAGTIFDHFFDDRSHFVEMTTEMAAPLEESIPTTRSSHHLRMGSLSSRNISSNRIYFFAFQHLDVDDLQKVGKSWHFVLAHDHRDRRLSFPASLREHLPHS